MTVVFLSIFNTSSPVLWRRVFTLLILGKYCYMYFSKRVSVVSVLFRCF